MSAAGRARALGGLVVLVLAAAGCGGGKVHAGLAWVKTPALFTPPTLPNDRVLRGVVRNAGLRAVRVQVRTVELLDASGSRVAGVATFADGYLHGLYPPTREPLQPDEELVRTGRLAKLKPGGQTPLSVAWRLKRGQARPTTIAIAGTRLRIPPG